MLLKVMNFGWSADEFETVVEYSVSAEEMLGSEIWCSNLPGIFVPGDATSEKSDVTAMEPGLLCSIVTRFK
jgi:hypothetical protein